MDAILRHGAAPSLPDAYCKAIDGVAIGPEAVSFGAAAYRREPVIVADIAADPLWRDYRDLAAAHSLRSCWSTPILSSHGAALGVFGDILANRARADRGGDAPHRSRRRKSPASPSSASSPKTASSSWRPTTR